MSKEKVKELKILKRYVINAKGFDLVVQVEDENGKKIPEIDTVSGVHIRVNRKPQYQEEIVEFANVVASAKKGYLSQYNVTEETPKYIAGALEDRASDRAHPVMTYEQWIKENNPERHAEMVRADKAEAAAKEAFEAGKAEALASVDGDVVKKLNSEKLDAEVKADNAIAEAKEAKKVAAEKDKTIAKLMADAKKLEKGANS